MNKTKTALAALFVLLASAVFGHAQVQLTGFGTNAFAVDSSSDAGYSQSASSLTFTNFSNGKYVSGLLSGGSVDWSPFTNAPYTGFALNMSVSGANPNAAFSFDLLDSLFTPIDTYEGSTTTAGGTLQLINLTLRTAGTQNYSDVRGLSFTWNGTLAAPDTVTVESFNAIVPEPSTLALLAAGGLALAGYAFRRRG